MTATGDVLTAREVACSVARRRFAACSRSVTALSNACRMARSRGSRMPTRDRPKEAWAQRPDQGQSGSWGGQASDGADAESPFGGAGWGQTEYGYGRASGYGQQARASGYGRWGNAPAGGNTGYGGYGPQAPLSTGWPGAAGYGYGAQWGARGADWTVPPRRGKSYKTLWITLSVIATLLICACCGSCFAIYKFTQEAVVPIAAAAF